MTLYINKGLIIANNKNKILLKNLEKVTVFTKVVIYDNFFVKTNICAFVVFCMSLCFMCDHSFPHVLVLESVSVHACRSVSACVKCTIQL